MYEDCIVKNVISTEQCRELAAFFLTNSAFAKRGIRGKYSSNRLTLLCIDYANNRTEWFDKISDLRDRAASVFNVCGHECFSWVSLFLPPCELPLHVDTPVKNRIRLIVLLQRPQTGGDVVLSQHEHGEKVVLPLEVGAAYNLPAHKYFHGISFFDCGPPRVAVGLDYLC